MKFFISLISCLIFLFLFPKIVFATDIFDLPSEITDRPCGPAIFSTTSKSLDCYVQTYRDIRVWDGNGYITCVYDNNTTVDNKGYIVKPGKILGIMKYTHFPESKSGFIEQTNVKPQYQNCGYASLMRNIAVKNIMKSPNTLFGWLGDDNLKRFNEGMKKFNNDPVKAVKYTYTNSTHERLGYELKYAIPGTDEFQPVRYSYRLGSATNNILKSCNSPFSPGEIAMFTTMGCERSGYFSPREAEIIGFGAGIYYGCYQLTAAIEAATGLSAKDFAYYAAKEYGPVIVKQVAKKTPLVTVLTAPFGVITMKGDNYNPSTKQTLASIPAFCNGQNCDQWTNFAINEKAPSRIPWHSPFCRHFWGH